MLALASRILVATGALKNTKAPAAGTTTRVGYRHLSRVLRLNAYGSFAPPAGVAPLQSPGTILQRGGGSSCGGCKRVYCNP